MGLGSSTKIYLLGTIAIAEVAAFLLAPFIFCADYGLLKRDRFLPFIVMIFVLGASMLLSSFCNHTATPFVIKSAAIFYSIFAHLVVFHRLMRDNYYGLGWFLLGVAVSGIITIFYFNPTARVTEQGMAYVGDAEVEEIVQGPLFWANKIVPFVLLPITALYLKTPTPYSILAPFSSPILIMRGSVSGRSASLSILLACAMILVGRKSRKTMALIGRYFFVFLALAAVMAIVGKMAYKYAALNNYLGDQARIKYENQTKGGESLLKLLMTGRKEFFAAIPAALEKPIIGHGPFARDENGYWERFLSKYGEIEDLQAYYYMVKKYGSARVLQIPTHSYIMGFWVHYGIGGLIFWIYVVMLIYRHLRKYANAVPQWYGYFAFSIANFAWALFFSPFSGRATFSMMICCLLFARAIGNGQLRLPIDMEMEARRND